MKSVRFNRLAEREIDDAFRYYEEESAGLGERFLEEVESGIAFLRRYPEAAPKITDSIRRFVLPNFPYSLLYRPLSSGVLRILAVAHQKREPYYWMRRR